MLLNLQKTIKDFLLEKSSIEKKELEKIEVIARQTNSTIESVLLKRGTILEEELLSLFAEYYEILFEEKLEEHNIQKLIHIVPYKFIQKYQMVPYSIEGNIIRIAIRDPLLVHPLDEIKLLLSNYDIVPVLATESELLRIIHQHYESSNEEDGDSNLEGIIENVEDIGGSIDLANEAPIIRIVNVIISNAVSEKASDIHIEPQEKRLRIRYRIDGMLKNVLTPPRGIQNGIISRIKIMANMNIAENRLPQDGRIQSRLGGKEIDIRVSSLPSQFGERVVMRILNKTDTKFSLETIGFEKPIYNRYKKILSSPYGIVLITGPTGSGKTSTLYASLTNLNQENNNILTVEDPIEYQIEGISQIQAKPKIGLTFAEVLRIILRQDPDIIMVGEIRDQETARVAIQSALTGHLVFSTLHTNDAPSAITRLLDMGIENYLVASTCIAFMAQRLVRMLCNHCKKKSIISIEELSQLGIPEKYIKKKKQISIYQAIGCKECFGIGYKGRIGIYELLPMDNALREVVSHTNSLGDIRMSAEKYGMETLREAGLKKVIDGTTSIEEVLRVS